jgi:hypothetical protein
MAGGFVGVWGWTLDPDAPTTVGQVHLYIDGPAGSGARGVNLGAAALSRPDVAAAYPGSGAAHGFNTSISGIAPGAHTLYLYGINVAGGGDNVPMGTKTVTVPALVAGSPFGSFDSATGLVGGTARVAGWTIDPSNQAATTSVHVYVDGWAGSGARGINIGLAKLARPDVAKVYPAAGPNHGFNTTITGLTPGSHTLYVYAINAAGTGENPLLLSRTITVGKASVLARTSAGALYVFPGTGTGGLLGRKLVSSGWASYNRLFSAGDFNGDGKSDLMGRTSAGALYLFPGNGSGGFLAGKLVSTGWGSYNMVFSVSDFNGDGRRDLMARTSAGALYLFPGKGTGGVLARKLVSSGWSSYNMMFSGGDSNGDGKSDVLARTSAGALYLFPGKGTGGVLAGKLVSSGWSSYNMMFSGGDSNGDGKSDVLARTSAGALYLFPGKGTGGLLARKLVSSGWGAYNALTVG